MALDGWGVSGRPTSYLVVAMGFVSLDGFGDEVVRIRDLVVDRRPMTRMEWTRAMAATEVIFGSEVFGAGTQWPAMTGYTDEESIAMVRRIQLKLTQARARVARPLM